MALAVTVTLWSSFALSTRYIGYSSLAPVDVALLRFVAPLALLMPWIPRATYALVREKPYVITALMIGGLPHFLLFALGARLTTAGLTGLLVPGAVPLFVTLLTFAVRRSRVTCWQGLALTLIAIGVSATAAWSNSTATLVGVGVLLSAGLAWACYTVGLQETDLGPLDVTIAVCVTSTFSVLVLIVVGIAPSSLMAGSADVTECLLFVVIQGVGTGLLSALCYAFAVRSLGSGIASVTGAASPVLTTLLAAPLFDEPITGYGLLSLALIVAGIVGFNLAPNELIIDARRACEPRSRGLRRWVTFPRPASRRATSRSHSRDGA